MGILVPDKLKYRREKAEALGLKVKGKSAKEQFDIVMKVTGTKVTDIQAGKKVINEPSADTTRSKDKADS